MMNETFQAVILIALFFVIISCAITVLVDELNIAFFK